MAPPTTTLPDIASVVERVAPAVVQVLATLPGGSSQGSGVIFNQSGHVLANNHVVEDATRVEAVLSNRTAVVTEVVGTDPEAYLAGLKIPAGTVDDLVVAEPGDTDAMRIGDWVITIGSPLGLEGSVTVGVISAKGRSLTLDATTRLYDLVQTDAVINPGHSGGRC